MSVCTVLRSKEDPKFVYYLSAEFLMGRSLTNTVQNLELTGPYAEAVKSLGYSLEDLIDAEQNAALGNGGLGRLAVVLHRLHGHARPARLGLRHPVQVRHVQAGALPGSFR